VWKKNAVRQLKGGVPRGPSVESHFDSPEGKGDRNKVFFELTIDGQRGGCTFDIQRH